MATFAFHYFPGGLLLLFYQASAFPAAESPPSSDNDSVLAVSELPTKPKYNYAAGSGRDRDRHCKQTRQWQDVTQIYLEGHNGKDALLVHLQLGGGGGGAIILLKDPQGQATSSLWISNILCAHHF